MAKASVLLAAGGAILPDGTAGNAAPARQTTKSSAAAPSLHFQELLFDPDTDEMCYWVFRAPVSYLGTVTAKLHWKANAIVGDCVWNVAVAAISPGDVDTPNEKALAAASAATATVDAVEARRLVETSITVANLDGLAAGDMLVVYVGRDANNAADTLLVDAELTEVNLEFDDEGVTVLTGADAGKGVSERVRDLYLPSDGFQVYRHNGTSPIPWGPIFPFTAPVNGDFAWINQGGASVDTTYGGIYLLGPAGVGNNLRIRKKAAPVTPYTITACILPHMLGVNYATVGLVFRESVSGKLATCVLAVNTNFTLAADKFTNPTTYSANYVALRYSLQSPIFLRIADNGANRICSWSQDGQHWLTFHSIGRTDFLTADEVGFFVDANNVTYPAAITLLSWKEA